MKKIERLKFGFSDAENYKRNENKELFNQLFLRNNFLEKIIEPSTTFLVGDKGTGKTAYAVFLSNNEYKKRSCSVRYIRETEYRKFIALKNERQLELSDYASIWKVIIYLMLSEQIYEREAKNPLFSKFTKLHALHRAIEQYYASAFSPEIAYALQFVKESKLAAKLIYRHLGLQVEKGEEVSFSESRFQTNLLYIQNNFETALRSLKLQKHHVLFIDGIDIRPESIPYDEYLDCIRGLANAVWEVNNDFFSSIKDSPGRLRAVLLVRPDIFVSLGLQNQNTKIRDNAVMLNWYAKYEDYRTSDIFAVIDKILANGQPEESELELGDAWDYYFPYETPNLNFESSKLTSFISFLRFAFWRPRDIITMLTLLQNRFVANSKDTNRVFNPTDFEDSAFKREYAEYLLGEVKDQLLFYYSTEEYEMFRKFFEFLGGRGRFTYEEYLKAFEEHSSYMKEASINPPRFMASAEEYLQFLYELNVISYIDRTESDDYWIRWSFKERSYSNISPKVRIGKEYEIFYGMRKALNVGRRLKSNQRKSA